jgi:dephospho-CoA kinase
MKIIGLTGSIGMGKSTAAKLLRVLKIPVFDSDTCVHDLLSSCPDVINKIAAAFPAAWDKKAHKIDRGVLGQIVFADPMARRKLEAILHPKVWDAQQKFIAGARRTGKCHVALDIPLLFETGRHRKCDSVLCVTAPHFIQRQRVLSRKGMNETKFSAVLSGQLPDHAKRKMSDFIIPTGLGRGFTLQRLKHTLRSIKNRGNDYGA